MNPVADHNNHHRGNIVKYRHFWIILLAIFAIGCAETELLTILDGGSHATITAPPEEVWQATRIMREEQNISLTAQKAFYTKYIDAAGIAILANTGVADQHLIEARNMIVALTAKRPELRDILATQKPKDTPSIASNPEIGGMTLFGQGFYMILVDFQTNMPERGDLPPFSGGSCHMRGSLRTGTLGYCYANLFNPKKYPNIKSPIQIFVHEFAHAIHFAIRKLDPTFDERLRQAYAHQMGSLYVSKPPGCEIPYTERELKNPEAWITGEYEYAQANCREYWAVAIEYWCYGFVEATDIQTHEAFRERDPLLTKLIEEWLPRIPARK